MEKYTLDELSIEITYACNMRCLHCSSSAGKAMPGEMNTDRIVELIHEAAEKCGTTAFSVSGGDPLCHPDLFDILDVAYDHNMQILLYTSGVRTRTSSQDLEIETYGHTYPMTTMEARALQKYAQPKKSDNRWGKTTGDKFKIIFGVHGADARVHDKITKVGGSFASQQDSILECVRNGLYVACHFVPTALNYREIPNVVDYFDALGAHEISLLRYVSQGRGLKNDDKLVMSKEQFKELQQIIINEKKRAEDKRIHFRPGIPIDFTFLCAGGWSKPKPCDGGKTKILVRPNGEVNVCPAWKNLPKFIAGNLKEQSLVDVWENSPVYKMFRNFKPSMLVGPCSECPNLNTCQGGCAAQRILLNGNINQGPDPLCFRNG